MAKKKNRQKTPPNPAAKAAALNRLEKKLGPPDPNKYTRDGAKSGTARSTPTPIRSKHPADVNPPSRTSGSSPTEMSAANKKAKRGKPRSGSAAARQGSVMTCRECLRTKPLNQFPNPRRKRCEACGGQPQSSSVRYKLTVAETELTTVERNACAAISPGDNNLDL